MAVAGGGGGGERKAGDLSIGEGTFSWANPAFPPELTLPKKQTQQQQQKQQQLKNVHNTCTMDHRWRFRPLPWFPTLSNHCAKIRTTL